MVQDGPLIDLALEFLGNPRNPRALARQDRGGTLIEPQRVRLQRFIAGVRSAPVSPPIANLRSLWCVSAC